VGRRNTFRRPDETLGSFADRGDVGFNEEMARQLRQAADLLEAQHANRNRVRAYRRAAESLLRLEEPASSIYWREGLKGLVALPAIGRTFALAIVDVVEVGRWRWLDRLEGEVDPERLLATVAGIGPGLARRIHDELSVETLEDLELAATDGRLATVDGFGAKRLQSVRDSLAGRLGFRGHRWHDHAREGTPVPIEDLLDIDLEYRRAAEAGQLPTIVPRRFNPDGSVEIPVLHTTRNGQHFTALYSNTPMANELQRTDDWVVIYADAPDQGQWTVITATRGEEADQRVVRGWADPPGR